MVSRNTLVTAAAALVSTGSLAFAGATLASADTSTGESSTATATAAQQDGRECGPGGHAHTQVTGAEATKVTQAVTKKDSAVTVERVMKDADGSYDVMGTKSGERVMVEVSKDLATIEVREGVGPGGHGGREGRGGHGPMNLTEVTGAEKTKVVAALQAKDSTFTPEDVRKDDQGTYLVMGAKGGERAMARVSADLKTIEVHTGRPDGPRGDSGAAPNAPATVPSTGTSPTDVPSTNSTTSTTSNSAADTTRAA
ncbi:hypothetical protein [Mobilicoccus massiliensis]|uniref:hypothetical protein n=1 Tax=Mobilicoccus massiliensis TaxID=1522310 RepID=UPI00058CCE58|nr:hypothetical protein [Mobilicoccus massiliensis]